MKVIIAGMRDYENYEVVKKAIDFSEWTITEIVSGKAPGVDSLGERWAKENNIPVKHFPADWNKHGASAGPIRNREMAVYADGLIAVWNGISKGTHNMIHNANREKLSLFIHRV